MALPSTSVSEPQDLSIGLLDDTGPPEVYDHVPAYDDLSDIVTQKDPVSERISHLIAATSTVESGYGGSEVNRSTPSRPRDRPSNRRDTYFSEKEKLLWPCRSCHKSFHSPILLGAHECTKLVIDDGTAKHRRWGASSLLDKAKDGKMTMFKQGKLPKSLNSPWRTSKLYLGGTPDMDAIMYQQPFPTIEAPEIMSNPHTPLRLPSLENSIQQPNNKYHSESTANSKMRRRTKTGCLTCRKRRIKCGEERPTCTNCVKSSRQCEGYNQRVIFKPPIGDWPNRPGMVSTSQYHTWMLPNASHSSSKDEVKLMDYQNYDTTNKLYKAKVNKKQENPDDDASHRSESLVDSSEEGDDSDYECDNIITWNYSQHDAPLSFLPYIRGHDENTSSPCSDSPESGSTTSGTASDTPALSSGSGLAGGNGLQGNGYPSPTAGTGFPNNDNNPVLGTKEESVAKVADPQPLPLICWYPAAGIACDAKHVSSSSKTRYLWRDHAWGKSRQAPNHRLSDACQLCRRLFLTQQSLEEHVENVARQGLCRALSDVELEEYNREPNRRGISLECKNAIEKIRKYIEKEMKGDKLPALREGDIEKLLKQRVDINVLKQRVDSNLLLYINGSNTSEKTARSELWKWYLIFKKLRPDDEFPINPFIPAQRLAGPEGRFRADALRTFMHVFDQRRMEGCLPQLDDDQRTALNRVFLDTLDMLNANETSNRHRSVQARRNPRKRQKTSPPEDHGPTPDLTDPTLAHTTPELAPAPILVETHPSVRNPVNFQHPTFTLPEVQNQLLPQTPSSVPRSFMPSADDCWQVQQQNEQQRLWLQQEAEEAHSRSFTGDLIASSATWPRYAIPKDVADDIKFWTEYGGLSEFGTRDC